MVRTLDDATLSGSTVGVRIDVNSPIDGDSLRDDTRLRAHVPTLEELLERGGRVAVLAHQGRPGGDDFTTLSAHASRLDELLDFPVGYVDETHGRSARQAIRSLDDGDCVVLENTRFYSEEPMTFEPDRAARTHLVSRLEALFDCFVNDAFAAAHRSQPSIVGFPAVLPSYAGRLMEAELDALGDIESTATPRVYVLGGAKVSGSIDVARTVLEKGLADTVLVAGLVGNVFLLADGVDLGGATIELIEERGYRDEIERANELLETFGDRIELPVDVVFDRDGERVEHRCEDGSPTDGAPAMDVGSETIDAYRSVFDEAKTVVLNGPAGVYERPVMAEGTRALFEAATAVDTSIVGGDDTAGALRELGIEGFTHVSTGGGAALTLLTGDSLVAVEAIENAPPHHAD